MTIALTSANSKELEDRCRNAEEDNVVLRDELAAARVRAAGQPVFTEETVGASLCTVKQKK